MQTLTYEKNLSAGEDGGRKTVRLIELSALSALLPKHQREKIFAGYDLKNIARIFEDGAMMNTADAFLDNGMNVAKTARAMYMHRNTLLYRLNVIRRLTGLDLRNFDMAVTFVVLRDLYELK